MYLLNIDLSNVSVSAVMSAITFISTFSVLRYQVKEQKAKLKEHKERTNKRFMDNDEKMAKKFKEIEDKHDNLKDELTEKIHQIDKNITKILTILNKAE